MTTNKEALQKIFEAALKEPEPTPTPTTKMRSRAPTEQHPQRRKTYGEPSPEVMPRQAIQSLATQTAKLDTPTPKINPTEPLKTAPALVAEPATTLALTETPAARDATSLEIANILDQKISKERSLRKLKLLLTAILAIGGIGGTTIWFIQSPERITSLKSIFTEVKAATDVESITDEYSKSLDKIADHSNELDEATTALGVTAELKEGEDAYMGTKK